jgi:hypothetical protein
MVVIPCLENQMERHLINQYRREMKRYVMTSRFNNATSTENARFRRQHEDKLGCVYCAPLTVAQAIPVDAVMFVLEMNNDTNKIMGIGMVRNHPRINLFQVYQNNNFNRYTYTGKCRIDRNSVSEDEDIILRVFDVLCFTGHKHMKRGQGLTAFPVEMLCRCAYNKIDLVDFIVDMFKQRITV